MQIAAATPPRERIPQGKISHYLAPVALLVLIGAIVFVIASSGDSTGTHTGSQSGGQSIPKNLPRYWTVRAGDTFDTVASKTKLSISQLEAFNSSVDPRALIVGERLNLRPSSQQPPPQSAAPSHPPWPGPHLWTVRSGESFGSIAAKSGVNITTLLQLNPQLKPSALQPGNVVRLQPGPDVTVDLQWIHLF